ncbi:MAG: FapA family protein [Deltaproteobacteria bacterium]
MATVNPATFEIIEKIDGFYIRLAKPGVKLNDLEAELFGLNFRISNELMTKLFDLPPKTLLKIDPSYEESAFMIFVRSSAQRIQPITLNVANDAMTAYITINKDTYQMPGKEEVLKFLENNGIKFGIDADSVNAALDNPDEKTMIANGRPAINGEDGSITYHYHQPSKKPVLLEDGSVDYYQLGFILPIRAGESVADRVWATEGKPGMTVWGDELPAKDGRNPEFKVGKGIIVSENKAVAEFDGALDWVNNRIQVIKAMIINGDVDFSIGNLDFMGKLIITGSVKEGFEVTADGDVEIRGGVENARVESRRGSVFIHSGVIGRGNAVIIAAKNIEARFAQGMEAEAGQNIIVNEYVLRCDLKAGDSVLIHGRKGMILGNNSIKARTRIKASRIQNCEVIDMQVEGIERRQFHRQIVALNQNIEKKDLEIRLLSDQIRKSLGNIVDPTTVAQLEQKLPQYIQMTEEYDTMVEQRNSLVSMLKNTRGEGMIQIGAGLQEGMTFSIKDEPAKLTENLRNMNMYFDPDERKILVITDRS